MQFRQVITTTVVVIAMIVNASAAPIKIDEKLVQTGVQYGYSEAEMMDLVELKAPKDDLIQALDDLATQIRTEQNDHTHVYNVEMAGHDEIISTKTAELEHESDLALHLNISITQLESEILSDENLMASLQEERVYQEQQISETQSERDAAIAERASSKQVYDNIAHLHEHVLYTLDNITNLVNSFDFEDANSTLTGQNFSESLYSQSRMRIGVALKRLNVALNTAVENAGNTTSEEQNAIRQRIVSLLNRIRQGVQQSLDLYGRDEADAISYHQQTIDDIDNVLSSYQDSLNTINNQISTVNDNLLRLRQNLDEQQTLLATTMQNIAALEALLADEQAAKEHAEADYAAATQARHDQLDQVDAARQYVVDNIHGMTAAETCHVEAQSCMRCLYDEHCFNGDVCSNDGHCEQPRTIVSVVQGEGHNVHVQCPQSEVIEEVLFSSYGTPTGSSMDDFTISSCHSASSESVVASRCVSLNSCTVRATNGVFGDPCRGTYKRLAVAVACV